MSGPGRVALGRGLFWSALGAAVLVTALAAGWRALAAVNFGYPLAYELLDIERTIARYGPENRARPGFHTTDEAERERIFGAIATAVRARGKGLEAITYTLPGGRRLPVLTPPEVVHLRDVAALVTAFERVGWGALAALAGLAAIAWQRRWVPPPTRRFAAGLGVAVAAAAALVLALGPVTVFYWLHERIFPPDHPWFFWYEESLMSMLMQAPNLFGVIALAWLALAVPAACLLWTGGRRVLVARAA